MNKEQYIKLSQSRNYYINMDSNDKSIGNI